MKHAALCPIGSGAFDPDDYDYARASGRFTYGAHAPRAEIPFIVEAWVSATSRKGQSVEIGQVFGNRTAIVGDEISAYRNVYSKLLLLAGCGLDGVGLDNWPLGDVTAALHIAIAGRNGRRLGRLPIDSSGISRETETALRRALVKSRDRLPLDMPEPQELPPPTRPPKVEPPPKLPREVYQPLGVGADSSGSNVGRVGVGRGSGRTGVCAGGQKHGGRPSGRIVARGRLR